MLQTIHKLYRSILGIFIIALISLSMLFFGMDFGGGSREVYAVQVGDQAVSFADFSRRKQEIMENFRRTLGENYQQVLPMFLKNIDSQLVDTVISELLTDQLTKDLALFSSKARMTEQIQQIFPSGISKEEYGRFLASLGTTAFRFESRIGQETIREQFRDIIRDVSLTTQRGALAMLREEETSYDVQYVSFTPDYFEKQVASPTEQELQDHYDNNATDYEIEAEVSYRFVVLAPQDHLNLVEVFEDDIELYYTEHEREFSDPEQFRVRQIKLALEENATPDQELAQVSLADELYERLVAGEPFGQLVAEHSDDKKSKGKGGDIGWIKKGDLDPRFERALLSKKEGGFTDVQRNSSGFFIFSVEDYQAPIPKPLSEVRAQIEETIRKEEAPAYVSAYAEDLYDKWLSSDSSLMDFATAKKLTTGEQTELATKSTDPSLELRGLTAKVLNQPNVDRQIIELRDKTLLVEVTDFSDRHIPPLEQVRKQVAEDFKKQIAYDRAREEAQEFFHRHQSSETPVSEFSSPDGLKLEAVSSLKRSEPGSGIFREPALQKSLFSARSTGVIGKIPFESGNAFHVVHVSKVTLPEESILKEKLKEHRKVASEQLSQGLHESVMNQLRKDTEIDVNAGVYGG